MPKHPGSEDSRKKLLGKGQARKASDVITQRTKRNSNALAATRAALGLSAKREAQTTDSNN